MGINVTALRNRLVGGGARPSLFFATIYFPTNVQAALDSLGFDTQDISFFIKASSIPESTLGEITKTFLGRDVKLPSIDRTFAPWSVTILNDENYKIRHFFEAWIEYISPGASIFEAQSGFGSTAGDNVYGQMQVHQLQKDGAAFRMHSLSDTPPLRFLLVIVDSGRSLVAAAARARLSRLRDDEASPGTLPVVVGSVIRQHSVVICSIPGHWSHSDAVS